MTITTDHTAPPAKVCAACRTARNPAADFYADRTQPDGRSSRCITCIRATRRARTQAAEDAAQARARTVAPLVRAVLADIPGNRRAAELLSLRVAVVAAWRDALTGGGPLPFTAAAVAARIEASPAANRRCAACRRPHPWTAYAPASGAIARDGRDMACRPCRATARGQVTARAAQDAHLAEQQRAVSPGHAAPVEGSMSWGARAACAHEDAELFFPVGTTGPALLQTEEAKQVCRGCPVRQMCLDWAMTSGISHGVAGGLSEEEREALKRRNSRKRSQTRAAA